jgi:hypothetical protein
MLIAVQSPTQENFNKALKLLLDSNFAQDKHITDKPFSILVNLKEKTYILCSPIHVAKNVNPINMFIGNFVFEFFQKEINKVK